MKRRQGRHRDGMGGGKVETACAAVAARGHHAQRGGRGSSTRDEARIARVVASGCCVLRR